MVRRVAWIFLYAIAMAFVESAVVVYLRAIYYPAGFEFPIVIIPDRMAAIEIGREAATMVMLMGIARLGGRDRWERFLFFCVAFGVWDVFYYIWLVVFLGWPSSLMTWDILFLIPVPWIGPVLAPVMVSVGLIAGAMWLLRLRGDGGDPRVPLWHWLLAIAGGFVVVLSFTIDYKVAFLGKEPPPFRWWLFLAGFSLGLAALLASVSRMRRPRAPRTSSPGDSPDRSPRASAASF